MTLNLHAPETEEQLQPRITVAGVGGAGSNAVNNMIQSNLEGVEFLVCNTDAQALTQSLCGNRLQLGRGLTRGLGGGSRPDVGRAAAEETMQEVSEAVGNSDMLFIAAGMGGATGTGAAPVIARAAREKGILTVAVVTKPFTFEGVHRMRVAEQGIQELAGEVDTLIIIPNQNLFRIANEKTTFADAFKMADEVLYSGVRGVTDLVVKPGLINLDFADIRSVMTEMGKAMMGTGEADGENRAIASAEAAIANPLLDDVSMQGARGVLINITGGPDLTLFEVDEAANRIRDEVDGDANIIFGSTFDPTLEGTMQISVVATGIEAQDQRKDNSVTLSLVADGNQGQSAAQPQQQQPRPVQASMGGQPQQQQTVNQTTMQQQPFGSPNVASAAAQQPQEASFQFHQSQQPQAAQPQPQPQQPAPEPQAYEREEHFIAPEPMQPPRKPQVMGSAPEGNHTQADPYQGQPQSGYAPAQQQSRPEPRQEPRRKPGGLFSKVTGVLQGERDKGRSQQPRPEEPRFGGEKAEPAAPRQQQSQQQQQQQQQQQPQQPAAPSQPAQQQQTSNAQQTPRRGDAVSQPRLSGLDPQERQDARAMEEDQLDIPAFLRRQAN